MIKVICWNSWEDSIIPAHYHCTSLFRGGVYWGCIRAFVITHHAVMVPAGHLSWMVTEKITSQAITFLYLNPSYHPPRVFSGRMCPCQCYLNNNGNFWYLLFCCCLMVYLQCVLLGNPIMEQGIKRQTICFRGAGYCNVQNKDFSIRNLDSNTYWSHLAVVYLHFSALICSSIERGSMTYYL